MTLDSDAVERQHYDEFLDEARDVASGLQVLVENVRSGAAAAEQAIETLRRQALSLRTACLAVNSPLIKLVGFRLTEYLDGLDALGAVELDDIQVFLERIQGVADGTLADTADAFEVVRSLPAKKQPDVDFGSVEQKDVEILLVVPEKALSRIVERELAACGYRVSNVRDPFAALETAVRTRPDMVLAAMELEGMSGIDLAAALAVIQRTQSIPFALLTSYAWGHPKLKGLPPRAALIHKGPRFGDDLAETLARFDIT